MIILGLYFLSITLITFKCDLGQQIHFPAYLSDADQCVESVSCCKLSHTWSDPISVALYLRSHFLDSTRQDTWLIEADWIDIWIL